VDRNPDGTGRFSTVERRRMPGGVTTRPAADFCAAPVDGRDLPGVARELRISRTQMYAILGGETKRPTSNISK
jgi:hypothetical protein